MWSKTLHLLYRGQERRPQPCTVFLPLTPLFLNEKLSCVCEFGFHKNIGWLIHDIFIPFTHPSFITFPNFFSCRLPGLTFEFLDCEILKGTWFFESDARGFGFGLYSLDVQQVIWLELQFPHVVFFFKPSPLAVRAPIPNHWIAREFLPHLFLKSVCGKVDITQIVWL